MRKYVTAFLSRLAILLELCISVMLAIGIILLSLRLATSLVHIPDLNVYPNYEDLLESCFNLIIGVELIRMMYYHSSETVFEVLLFAIARQIIIEHSSPWSSLIGVCAIAVLFATRKYLFCGIEHADKNIFRANSKIKVVNKIMEMSLPGDPESTLVTLLAEKLEAEEAEIGVGSCAYFPDCGLRVAKMHDGKISRIEVIHAIH